MIGTQQVKAIIAKIPWSDIKSRCADRWPAIRRLPAMFGFGKTPAPSETAQSLDCTGCRALLDYSCRITQSFEDPLRLVMRETEQSAMDIMGCVKDLDLTAAHLVDYLTKADEHTVDMQVQINGNEAIIDHIAHFMQKLPEKIEAERQGALERVVS